MMIFVDDDDDDGKCDYQSTTAKAKEKHSKTKFDLVWLGV